jgi:hypothetical protein
MKPERRDGLVPEEYVSKDLLQDGLLLPLVAQPLEPRSALDRQPSKLLDR